ncbi:MAG: hypothetical protein AAF732_19165 [Pseudomonadota bacterium]
MTKLIYRGVAFDTDQAPAEERVIRRPELVYRGVAHNGIRPIERTSGTDVRTLLVYRGQRLA